MTCDEAEVLLNALIDGELDAGHAREVEQHIAGCARCSAAMAAYRKMSEAVAAAIPGSRLTIMKRMGHFPMIENYPGFRPYLLDALRHVAG